jgi:hyperosmotically inducible periplasmic protein
MESRVGIMSLLIAVFCLIFAFSAVAVEQKVNTPTSKTTINLEEKKQDAAITAKVKLNLAADNLLKLHKIVVTTKAGVVTLTGVVSSQEQINKAGELTKSVEGVKGVNNKLLTKGPQPLVNKPNLKVEDQDVNRMKVR